MLQLSHYVRHIRMWKALLDRALHLHQDLLRFNELYEHIMLLVLLMNTATQVAMTFEGLAPAWVYETLEAIFLAFYMMECVLNLIGFGLEYFKSLWNILDFSVTLVGLVDLFLDSKQYDSGRLTTFFHLLKMFKVCRAFRILRTLRFFSGPKVIMKVIGKSLKMNGIIFVLMFCIFVMFSILFRQNLSKSDPKRFGSMLNTMSTLLQLLTLDDWISVYYTSRDNGAPDVIIFIVLYILTEYYILLSLIYAVTVDTILSNRKNMVEEQPPPIETTEQISGELTDDQTTKVAFSENNFNEGKNIRLEHCLRILEALEKNQQLFRKQTNYLYRLIESTEMGPSFYHRKEADEDEDEDEQHDSQ
ncbi:cation channel sperm-associated protein 1-like isoform X1 [Onychostoma macrolepis]|uniref:cation channel sperm-associated protein 1-like isoform X1 n=2 Tax=Onychostoma macrolepis TaxID=369639 RepID=UPI00272A9CD4|nr:cation channel sperm-associated protein 1-like isoform X1 [Onychostoma macrolepis]XP_058614535.1 cation channel sperm-associated protein 1-like isoform X1 [Onychostoma macrolepis]XP_058614536.1 cation channel sperm-associated protein 1-like isoform X1 [Onychostoma macrolepis]